jgi:hypothetical protein
MTSDASEGSLPSSADQTCPALNGTLPDISDQTSTATAAVASTGKNRAGGARRTEFSIVRIMHDSLVNEGTIAA